MCVIKKQHVKWGNINKEVKVVIMPDWHVICPVCGEEQDPELDYDGELLLKCDCADEDWIEIKEEREEYEEERDNFERERDELEEERDEIEVERNELEVERDALLERIAELEEELDNREE